MDKLSKGQVAVLAVASAPMAAVGIAGALATYTNMNGVLRNAQSAMGIVAVGEGGTLVAALIALAVTLMGQHTPLVVRAAMWLIPMLASGVGVALADTRQHTVVMAVTPMAMTVAGEGIAFVARRVVAYRTGTDIEQQRRSGLLLWHANRAANGRGIGRWTSKAAVWRLTKAFASTDDQLSVQLGEIQRYRISQGADRNLAAVLTGERKAPAWVTDEIARRKALKAPQSASQALGGPVPPAKYAKLLEAPSSPSDSLAGGTKPIAPSKPPQVFQDALNGLAAELDEAEDEVRNDPDVKLLTTAEVAELKGVKPGTVRSWKHRGVLRCTLVDGVPMYHPLDVANLD